MLLSEKVKTPMLLIIGDVGSTAIPCGDDRAEGSARCGPDPTNEGDGSTALDSETPTK